MKLTGIRGRCGDSGQAMSPRRYELGKRQAVIDESRRRVLDAARELLAEPTGYQAFTVDAVARRADVARATVYYQFRSKTGLLEALCDDLAGAGQMSDLPGAFAEADPRTAVHQLIAVFARFWAADRVAMRRLRALAALDPDVHAVLAARDDRRRQGLEVLIGRLTSGPPADGPPDASPPDAGPPRGGSTRDAAPDLDLPRTGRTGHAAPDLPPGDAVRVLLALTSFESFDTMAGPDRPLDAAVPLVTGLADAALSQVLRPGR